MEIPLMAPLVTKRLRIRRFEIDDADAFAAFMTDSESTRFMAFADEQKSPEGARALIEATIRSYDTDRAMFAFAVERSSTGTFVGFCGLTPQDETTMEIMYAVMPEARGQGYATEIAKALAGYALDELGYARVLAPIVPGHTVSRAVAAKAGFEDRGLVDSAEAGGKVHQFVMERVSGDNRESSR